MVVFSNHRLGPSAELLVSDDVAKAILMATAEAARPLAQARWQLELVLWLDARAEQGARILEVGDNAGTPEHFGRQRRFLVDAIARAAVSADHGHATSAFDRWRRLIEAHPADSVQVGRRWQWQVSA